MAHNVTMQNNENKTFYDTQQNIGSIKDISAEFSSVHRLVCWWEINNAFQSYFRTQSADQSANAYKSEQLYFYLKTKHAFTLDNASGLQAELSGWYTSAQRQGTRTLQRVYDLSVGISKQVFNNQGQLGSVPLIFFWAILTGL